MINCWQVKQTCPPCRPTFAKRCHEKGNISRSECKKTTLWPKCLFTWLQGVHVNFSMTWPQHKPILLQTQRFSQLPHSFFTGGSSSNSAGSSSCAPSVLLRVDEKNGGSNNFCDSLRIVADGCYIPSFVKVLQDKIITSHQNPKIPMIPDSRW